MFFFCRDNLDSKELRGVGCLTVYAATFKAVYGKYFMGTFWPINFINDKMKCILSSIVSMYLH